MLSRSSGARRPEPSSTHDELVRSALPEVRRIAIRLARRLPAHIGIDELIAAGHEGLVKAARQYDPARFPSFLPYARERVRGAMLDELRGQDSMTSYGRRQQAALRRTKQRLLGALGRPPTEDETARALCVPLDRLRELERSLAHGPALGQRGAVEPDRIATGDTDPLAALRHKEFRAELVRAVADLPERTRIVLALYYQEERRQAEIAGILGITESRVCQILREAARELGDRLKALYSEPPPSDGSGLCLIPDRALDAPERR